MTYLEKKKIAILNAIKSKKQETYIKDGLVLWLDGIENSRSGHVSTPLSVWEDLMDNYDFTLIYGTALNPHPDNIPFNSQCYANSDLLSVLYSYNKCTLEVVFRCADSSAQSVFMGQTKQFWYRKASNGICTSASGYPFYTDSPTTKASYSVIYDKSDQDNNILYQNNDICQKSSGGSMGNYLSVNIGLRRTNSDTYSYPLNGDIYCIRLYNRELTSDERTHNYNLDVKRFNL